MKFGFFGLAVTAVLATATSAFAVCDTAIPTSRYMMKGGEVHDTKSNLTWARCSVGQKWREGSGCTGTIALMTWTDAMKQTGGGWRVPTKDELATLSSPTCKDVAFPNRDSVAIMQVTTRDAALLLFFETSRIFPPGLIETLVEERTAR